jgi:hypothetical protein
LRDAWNWEGEKKELEWGGMWRWEMDLGKLELERKQGKSIWRNWKICWSFKLSFGLPLNKSQVSAQKPDFCPSHRLLKTPKLHEHRANQDQISTYWLSVPNLQFSVQKPQSNFPSLGKPQHNNENVIIQLVAIF